MALGETDYGLMGVVGGLTAFISFLNGIMASGIGRFYAISVGVAKKNPCEGLEECHRWFTTAVIVHTILPVILIVIGYPTGEWAVRHFLTIPPDRIQPCVWVWRCVCVSTFVGMVGVPFSAWYGAKQEIAELTIYSLITTTANVFFMYYAVCHPGEWLVRMACWTMSLSVIPQVIICLRAGVRYPECRFVWKHVNYINRVKEMLSYSGWLFIGTIGDIFSVQGMNVLINKFFGPAVNAAQNIAGTMKGHCSNLSGSLLGALWPAIINAYGAQDYVRMEKLAYQACKLAPLFMMIFAIPLAIEIDEVLALWLGNPPQYAAGLCILGLIVVVGDYTTHGFAIAMHATGRIALYQIVVGGVYLTVLPIAFAFLSLGASVYSTGVALIIGRWSCTLARMIMSYRQTGLSIRHWTFRVALPLIFVAAISTGIGCLPRLFLQPSLSRIFVTTGAVEVAILVLSCFVLLTADEKNLIKGKIGQLIGRGVGV